MMTEMTSVINSLAAGGNDIEISYTCGRRFIQKIHWEFVQGEFKPFTLMWF